MKTVFFLNGKGNTPRTYITSTFTYGANHNDPQFMKVLATLNVYCDPEQIGWDYVSEEVANRWKQSNS